MIGSSKDAKRKTDFAMLCALCCLLVLLVLVDVGSAFRVPHIGDARTRPQKEDLLQSKIRSSHCYVCTVYPNIAKYTQHHKLIAKIRKS